MPRRRPVANAPVRIRRGRVGDLGWMFYRQAVVYKQEFGYLDVFETYLAQGLAPFLENVDTARDCIWMAEQEGAPVGFIAIQHDAERPGWAKLRWFLVEKEARGLGVGRRLMAAAVAFAKRAGYRGIALWTVDDLAAAARLYTSAGFAVVEETDGCAWAPWGREQRWQLALATNLRPRQKAARPPRPRSKALNGARA